MNDPNIGRVVVDEDELQQRIRDLGKEITADYVDDPPLLVGILKGAFMFMADLARAIDLPVEFDFMAVSSYGSATRTSGVVRIVNNSRVQGGRIVDIRMPKELITRIQVVEYLRAFLLGRTAWSDLNALILISGAFGMFRRDVLIDVGGLDPDSIGAELRDGVLYLKLQKRP